MKIVITGGGSGGHFYPLISVVDKIREISEEKHILQPTVYYFADKEFDDKILFRHEITFEKIMSGKLRRGQGIKGAFLNLGSVFKVAFGTAQAFTRLVQIMPDAVFTNGGYIAFPVVLAAKILRIPVVIHVSDTVPSRVLLYAGKFADKISIAFPEAEKFFKKKERIALTGNPVRDEIQKKQIDGAYEYYNLNPALPTILFIGGSQGSQIMNETLIDALPELLKKYQIIHQTGKIKYDENYGRAGVVLMNSDYKERYKILSYLNNLEIKMAAGAADLVVSRAGAGSIYEIAAWELPSIMIPIAKEVSRDQETNAFSYARSGAAIVIRQKNLTKSILIHEVDRLFADFNKMKEMSKRAKEFYKEDANVKIATALLDIALTHEV